MRILRLAIGLLLVLLIHLAMLDLSPALVRWVDLFTILVVLIALDVGPVGGMLAGLLIGLAEDAFIGSLYGLHGFANTAIGYLAARLSQWVATQQTVVLGLFFAVGVALKVSLISVIVQLLLPTAPGPSILDLLLRVSLSAILGVGALVANNRVKRRLRVWRRSRRKRVKLGD